LEEKGIALEIIEYLKTPPDQQTLQDILNKLDINPLDLMRKGESVYKELNIDDKIGNDGSITRCYGGKPHIN